MWHFIKNAKIVLTITNPRFAQKKCLAFKDIFTPKKNFLKHNYININTLYYEIKFKKKLLKN